MHIKKITKLIESVQIQDVRLVDGRACTTLRRAKDAESVGIEIKTSAEVKEPPKDGTFYVLSTMNFHVFSLKATKRAVVSIKTIFELKYTIPKEMEPSRKELTQFAKTNGVFNAWPYWREFVQSMISRMGLPPILLPVFRLSKEGVQKARPQTTPMRPTGSAASNTQQ